MQVSNSFRADAKLGRVGERSGPSTVIPLILPLSMYAIGNGRSGTSIRSPIKSWEGRRCPTIGNGDNGKMRWRSSFLNDPFAPFATFS